jgi:hypothetical protein
MTTRTKLSITIYVWSAMMLLNVFSKPLHIPEPFQWVLIIGAFIPLGLTFYFIKRQKLEKLGQPVSTETAVRLVTDTRQSAKKRLILMMVLGVCVGLCAPLWLPVTGSTLGTGGDLICGIITAAVVCTIFGVRLRYL